MKKRKNKVLAWILTAFLLTGIITPSVQKTEAAETALSTKSWSEIQSVITDPPSKDYYGMGQCTGYVYWCIKEAYGRNWGTNSTVSGLKAKLDDAGITRIGSTSGTSLPSGVKAGDIVLFYDSGGTYWHCGIIGSGGKVYHNSSSYGYVVDTFSEIMSWPPESKPFSAATFYRGLAQDGYLQITKTSAKPAVTNGNDDFSLKGAKFNIKNSSGTVVKTVTTDANGKTPTVTLPAGKYTVHEVTAPKGYDLYTSSKNVTINAEKTSTVTVANEPTDGYIEITKKSSRPEITDGNDCYTVKGAKFTIYDSAGNEVKTITTDENGKAKTNLEAGTYTVKETQAPKGYALSGSSKNITIHPSKTGTLSFSNKPQNDPVEIFLGKADRETGEMIAAGNGELQNAEFTVEYYGDSYDVEDGEYSSKAATGITDKYTRQWVFKTDEHGEIWLQAAKEYFIAEKSTGDLYYDSLGKNVVFPLGTYLIYESDPPEGYLINTKVFARTVTGNTSGLEAVNTFNVPTEETAIKEQVQRGDLDFTKVSLETSNRMAGIPFLLTSKTTGESHVLFTDENGYASTAASWNKHSYKTNLNDEAYDEKTGKVDVSKLDPTYGIWFGPKSAINDQKGALIYDTYILDELECEKNENKTLIKGMEIVVYKEGALVPLGNITNENIKITTSAIDKETESKSTLARDNVTIVDTVSYEGITPGEEYKLQGILMDKETGDPLLIDGKEVTAEKEFTPSRDEGNIQVEFELDASDLAGKEIVVFETLLRGDITAAKHADINDEGQTIKVLAPEIDTVAINDVTGDHEAYATKNVSITDTVTYSNMLRGNQYVATGTLYDKATGEPLKIDGKKVTVEKEFFANRTTGSFKMNFEFDGSELAGKEIVICQEITWDGLEIASHKNMKDADQTIYFPEIKTDANDSESNVKLSLADDEATIIDTVSHKLLTVGKEYTLTATLMDQETGEPLLIDGKEVKGETTFTAGVRNGKQNVEITLNASEMEGKTVVVYEELTWNGHTMAIHKEIDDEKQTVHFPKIRTKALDEDTELHMTNADKTAVIIDTVSYENLIPDLEYTLSAVMMDQETGQPMMIDNSKITAETKFTPSKADGEEEVVFEFDARSLEGKTGVVFEELIINDTVVGEHKEISDAKQTIHFPKVRTVAIDSDTELHMSYADDEATIIDTVKYENVIPGMEYEITGQVVDADTGEVIENGILFGKVEESLKFTAEKSSGTEKLEFTFDASDLEGKTVVVFETITVNGKVVGEHKKLNDAEQTIHFPKVITEALDETTKDHLTFAGKGAVVVDNVNLMNILPDYTYKITGKLIDKETEKPLVVDGKEVTAEKVISADSTEELASLTYEFDASDLAGKTLVSFVTVEVNGKTVAAELEIDNETQTIHIPKTETKAIDSETQKRISCADQEITIIDTVDYSNVIPGKEYVIKGSLVDKKTGDPIEGATAEKVFTAEKEDGFVELAFTFDGSGYDGESVVVYETMLYNGHRIAEHKDLSSNNQTVKLPAIDTFATDSESNVRLSYADDKVTIIDKMEYANVLVGEKYEAKGILMDQKTNKPLLIDGKEITSEATFTASEKNGSVELEFDLNGETLAGKSIVVFEELYIDGHLIAFHKDIEDDAQTVHFPKIQTSVSENEEKDIYISPLGEVTMTDTVKYENVLPGLKYEVKGKLMDKETGEAAEVDGKAVISTATFTPDKASGEAEVTFTFNAAGLEGKTFVVFEELYINDAIIASHSDLDDTEQVFFVRGIATTVIDSETNTHLSYADNEATLTDTVEYENLEVTVEHKLVGTLVDKADGKVLTDEDGNPITAETTFTPEETDGKAEVIFKVNASDFEGKVFVVFEELYTEEGLVEEHKDINDEAQTMYFPEIKTNAFVDKQSNKTIKQNNAKVTDRVTYTNLIPGEKYTLTAALIDKKTEKCIATGEASFTAKNASGYEDVTIKVDAEKYDGKELVVFETLWYTDDKIADHEDLNDKAQTVKVDIPDPVKTGDETKTMILMLLMITATLSAIVGIATFRRSKA